MAEFTMTASNATGKGKPDPSFSSAGNAGTAIAKYGKENVTDATLGVLKDENGDFLSLPTVNKCYRELPANELMDYAPIPGLKDYLDAAIANAFKGHQPKGTYTGAVATPGGTGAIHHMIFNYVEKGQKFVIPNWHWGPYREIAEENEREWEMYQMFDENNEFSRKNLKDAVSKLLETQDSVMTIFNTPAHNPSGYTMTDEDWEDIMNFYRECAKKPNKKIIILWDMAYIDYAGDPDEVRSFLKYFEDLPENILLAVAYSMSKSFLVYGMRSGALIGVSSSKTVAEEFANVNTFSNRATWSNGSRGAQKMLAEITADPELKASVDKERAQFSEMLANRAQIFIKEAAEENLKILPYEAGFFITIPAKDSAGLANKLAQNNIFVIPLKEGIRLALSAVPTDKVPGLAGKIKAVFAGHEA